MSLCKLPLTNIGSWKANSFCLCCDLLHLARRWASKIGLTANVLFQSCNAEFSYIDIRVCIYLCIRMNCTISCRWPSTCMLPVQNNDPFLYNWTSHSHLFFKKIELLKCLFKKSLFCQLIFKTDYPNFWHVKLSSLLHESLADTETHLTTTFWLIS